MQAVSSSMAIVPPFAVSWLTPSQSVSWAKEGSSVKHCTIRLFIFVKNHNRSHICGLVCCKAE